MTNPMKLGASLYVPAVHGDILPIANGEKYPHLRSLILCTEDALAEADIGRALFNLARTLPRLKVTERLRFIRVRNLAVLNDILAMDGISSIDGFVLPKVTRHTLPGYFAALDGHEQFKLMITLETREVFCNQEMVALRELMLHPDYRARILALRIGGNDLLNLLAIRRPRGRTLYDTPLGAVIGNLVTTFKPYGFALTAPVFEYLDTPEVLRDEVERDLANGLIGKTAIHPEQVALIEAGYQVSQNDLEMAKKLLGREARAVFKMHDSMCELNTHKNWARSIMERASVFGISDDGSRKLSLA